MGCTAEQASAPQSRMPCAAGCPATALPGCHPQLAPHPRVKVLEAPQQLVDEELDVLLCRGLFWKAAKGRLVGEELDVLQGRRWGCLRTRAGKRYATAQPRQRRAKREASRCSAASNPAPTTSNPAPTAERLRRADDLVQVGVHDFVHHVYVPAMGETTKMGAKKTVSAEPAAKACDACMESSEARHVCACSHVCRRRREACYHAWQTAAVRPPRLRKLYKALQTTAAAPAAHLKPRMPHEGGRLAARPQRHIGESHSILQQGLPKPSQNQQAPPPPEVVWMPHGGAGLPNNSTVTVQPPRRLKRIQLPQPPPELVDAA